MSDWAVFWSGVGGVLAGAVAGAATSFLIARYTLLRTRADDKQLAQAERNEDAARRITEALLDLEEALSVERLKQAGPEDWLASINQAVESLVRVTKLDVPIVVGSNMRRRIYSARKSAEATRDWMLEPFDEWERGLITEDELYQELLEVLTKRPIYRVVAILISDLHVYRNSGDEPTQEQTVVTPPVSKYVKRINRLERQLRDLRSTQAETGAMLQQDGPSGLTTLDVTSSGVGSEEQALPDKANITSEEELTEVNDT